jgi:hypothetical protein
VIKQGYEIVAEEFDTSSKAMPIGGEAIPSKQ